MTTPSLKILMDGAKNTVVHITGNFTVTYEEILRLDSLRKPFKSVKLQRLLYSFATEGCLYWKTVQKDGKADYHMIVPLAGRGKFDFEEFHPLSAPEHTVAIALSTRGDNFMLMLDLEKV